jgi:hypothetical protein
LAARNSDEFLTVIEPSIPRDHRTGLQKKRLGFAARFFRGVESTIEDAKVVFRDAALSIRPVRCEHRPHFVEVLGIDRFAIEI